MLINFNIHHRGGKMQFKKLSKLTIASLLVVSGLTACGGGSSDDSGSNVKHSNIPPAPMPKPKDELSEAKEIINTAKLFINDAKEIQKVYENARDILTLKQRNGFALAISVPDRLGDYMLRENLYSLSSKDMNRITNALGDDIILEPKSDFTITRQADNRIEVKGTLKVTQKTTYGFVGSQRIEEIEEIHQIEYDGFKNDLLPAKQATKTTQGSFGFNKLVIGEGKEKFTLTANQNSTTLNGRFNKNVKIGSTNEIKMVDTQDFLIENATVALKNVQLTANDDIINIKEITMSFIELANQLSDGKTIKSIVPYHMMIKGQWKKTQPKTNIDLTVSFSTKTEDIKNKLIVLENESWEEKANQFVPVTVDLSIKGDVTKNSGKTIPLDFQATLNRNGVQTIKLDKLVANVEGKTLNITGQSDFHVKKTDTKKSGMFVFKQNNAHITLNFEDSHDGYKLKKDKSGKIADIMVGSKDFGDLIDSNSSIGITAKFTDNSLIVL